VFGEAPVSGAVAATDGERRSKAYSKRFLSASR
jgi:hypothetical protein